MTLVTNFHLAELNSAICYFEFLTSLLKILSSNYYVESCFPCSFLNFFRFFRFDRFYGFSLLTQRLKSSTNHSQHISGLGSGPLCSSSVAKG